MLTQAKEQYPAPYPSLRIYVDNCCFTLNMITNYKLYENPEFGKLN